MRQVSRFVPVVIAIAGIVTVAAVFVVSLLQGSIFAVNPVAPPLQTSVWVLGVASTAHRAASMRDSWRSRTVAYLEQRGFAAAQISPEPPLTIEYDRDRHEYSAEQIIQVRSSTYPPLARAMNALPRDVDPTERSATGTFPAPPFLTFAFVVCILCVGLLSLAVAALETREADVNRAPRGMHPFYVATQTLLIGLLSVLTLVYGHTLLPASRLPFVAVSAIGIGMLVLWLIKTLAWWQQSQFLRCAFVAYVAAIALVLFNVVAALGIRLT